MQNKNSDYGYNAVEYGYGRVRHRYAGELCDKQRYYKFKRLHFAYLAFAHKPHNKQQRYEDNSCTNENQRHKISIRKNFYNILAKSTRLC